MPAAAIIEATDSKGVVHRYRARGSAESTRQRAARFGHIFAESGARSLFYRSVYIIWPDGSRERVRAVGSDRRRPPHPKGRAERRSLTQEGKRRRLQAKRQPRDKYGRFG